MQDGEIESQTLQPSEAVDIRCVSCAGKLVSPESTGARSTSCPRSHCDVILPHVSLMLCHR